MKCLLNAPAPRMCNREGAIAHNDEDIGKDQGGYYDVSKLVATVGGRGIGVPFTVGGGLIAYRKSWFEEIGLKTFPDTWDGLLDACKKLKAKGRPLGQTAGRCDMPATATQAVLDTPAAEFRLPATDGKTYALDDVAGEKGTVVVFICNHCPYVKAVIDRMVSDARVLMSEGVGFAAICSNDAASYPEDSFENMKRFAKAHDFPFPYLHDETQTVARAYGAVCTPDFFGYNADRRLKYRGRLDEGRTTPPRAEAPRELVEAMRAIATTGVAPDHQKASIGCSIKWKDE